MLTADNLTVPLRKIFALECGEACVPELAVRHLLFALEEAFPGKVLSGSVARMIPEATPCGAWLACLLGTEPALSLEQLSGRLYGLSRVSPTIAECLGVVPGAVHLLVCQLRGPAPTALGGETGPALERSAVDQTADVIRSLGYDYDPRN